jgi:predicted ABC-type ATPase
MSKETPRLRMFAGPNGSDKSTLKSMIAPELLGIYVNPDEIEKEILAQKSLDLRPYGIITHLQELIDFLTNSSLLRENSSLNTLRFSEGKITFSDTEPDDYFPSMISDFIHNKLISSRQSFTFETVMSFPGKIALLQKAQNSGYRTYLYYIATEDPDINISRVHHRVKMGGHSVPKNKIITRYQKSLDLLVNAVRASNRAYIFDNSMADKPICLAEITDGKKLEMKADQMPMWFKNNLWDKFSLT